MVLAVLVMQRQFVRGVGIISQIMRGLQPRRAQLGELLVLLLDGGGAVAAIVLVLSFVGVMVFHVVCQHRELMRRKLSHRRRVWLIVAAAIAVNGERACLLVHIHAAQFAEVAHRLFGILLQSAVSMQVGLRQLPLGLLVGVRCLVNNVLPGRLDACQLGQVAPIGALQQAHGHELVGELDRGAVLAVDEACASVRGLEV
mmetsp:Transcript_11143/g.30812  ORF Transcript_11143/g.30812 Transcript_11143/m.30812 type:complete len:200 (+) Transcript_11143:489-1088(+)